MGLGIAASSIVFICFLIEEKRKPQDDNYYTLGPKCYNLYVTVIALALALGISSVGLSLLGFSLGYILIIFLTVLVMIIEAICVYFNKDQRFIYTNIDEEEENKNVIPAENKEYILFTCILLIIQLGMILFIFFSLCSCDDTDEECLPYPFSSYTREQSICMLFRKDDV